jgi:hypothetical protein
MEAIATGELRIEDLPREWRTLLGVEEDAPADDPSPLKMTRVRRKLLAELEWSNAQEWKGKGGTYDKIGHRAFLGVAWRTNRLEALGVATREVSIQVPADLRPVAGSVALR